MSHSNDNLLFDLVLSNLSAPGSIRPGLKVTLAQKALILSPGFALHSSLSYFSTYVCLGVWTDHVKLDPNAEQGRMQSVKW